MRVASLSSIYRYPVKALKGETLTRSEIVVDGIPGDRTRALIVTSEGHPREGKTYRGKENAQLHLLSSASVGIAQAQGAGVRTRIAAEAGRYFDVHPISLILDSWLHELARAAGTQAVEAERFRPNLVALAQSGFEASEADLVGRALRIGTSTLQVVAPITRCVTPTYDLRTGERNDAIARALTSARANLMGVYCLVTRPGTITTGDSIETIDPI
jgi:uncharacterized protein